MWLLCLTFDLVPIVASYLASILAVYFKFFLDLSGCVFILL